MRKLLIPVQGDFVAPRFDLATEILIIRYEDTELIGEPRTIIMEQASEEELCQMIVKEHITDIVCGGIEDLHYNFLAWKKVKIFDAVIGDWKTAMDKALKGVLTQGEIILEHGKELSL